MTNYPPTVEEKLELVSDVLTNIDYQYPMYEQCIRDVFGPLLLQQWLDGTELGFEVDEFEKLLKLTIARSLVEEMREEGLLDTIHDPQKGDDIVFLTQKGKSIATLLNTVNLN
jgi:hypothetical protein